MSKDDKINNADELEAMIDAEAIHQEAYRLLVEHGAVSEHS